jgi:hypothetical protein
MSLNPEFRRNLWLNLTWQRLLMAPTLVLINAYAFYISGETGYQRLILPGEIALALILGVWGTRRAADSLSEEVAAGTWDNQRMSGLSAWQMAWGKLIGGCAYVWYCALIVVAVLVWAGICLGFQASEGEDTWVVMYLFFTGAFLAHAVSLAIALLLRRKANYSRRLTITLAQTIGFLIFIVTVFGGMQVPPEPGYAIRGTIAWFGRELSWPIFRAILASLYLAWALCAVIRLIRAELGYRDRPWVWLLFMLFSLIVVAGLSPVWDHGPPGNLIGPFIFSIVLSYGAFFADHRDPVRYRAGLVAFGQGAIARGLIDTPWWVVGLAVTGAIVLALAATVSANEFFGALGFYAAVAEGLDLVSSERLRNSVLLVPLFMTRDFLVLLWLSFGRWRQRADMTGLLYLVFAYWPLLMIAMVLGHTTGLSAVLPIAGDNAAASFAPILVEIAVAGLLVAWRWRGLFLKSRAT